MKFSKDVVFNLTCVLIYLLIHNVSLKMVLKAAVFSKFCKTCTIYPWGSGCSYLFSPFFERSTPLTIISQEFMK